MLKVHLKDFALTGNFGPVKIGMSLDQVISLLGPPEGTEYIEPTTFLLYGWYEFFFDTPSRKLFAIQNDKLQANGTYNDEMILFRNKTIEIVPWFLQLNKDFTFSEVKQIMQNAKIDFSESNSSGDKVIQFESGVYFDFDDRDGEWNILDEGGIEKDEDNVIQNPEEYILNGIRLFSYLK